MKKRKSFLSVLVFFAGISFLTSCSAVRQPTGGGMNIQLDQVDYSYVDRIKEGESCSYSLFGLIGPFGDIKMTQAIKKARISQVTNYDYSYKHFILFSKNCIRVYGY